jgi:hypothetical protein
MLEIDDELRERREREWRQRVMAVIAEFGGQRRERLLVPEDDPANCELTLRLAGEVLFLRDQLRRIAMAVEWTQAGEPFGLIPPNPQVRYSRRGNGKQSRP